MRRTHPFSVILAGLACLALVGVITLAGLIVADWREVRHQRSSPLGQVVVAVDRGDRLHYVVHLLLGRVADLCPCTSPFAEDQYARAAAHARTGRQEALTTTERPVTLADGVADVLEMVGSGLRWAGAGSSWLIDRASR